MNQECQGCRFFRPQAGNNGSRENRLKYGTCRIDPPTVLRVENAYGEIVPRTFWPAPYMADPHPWCGEWTPVR